MGRHLKESVEAAGSQAAYDAQCKRLIANRQVLARLSCGVMQELEGVSYEDAERMIAETPSVGVVPVDDGDAVGVSVEDDSAEEGAVAYDVLYGMRLPGLKGSVPVMVNVEVERSRNSWTWLLGRAYYYCARMLSSQRNRTFRGRDYHKIRKVFSIWILPWSTKGAGTVTKLSMDWRMLEGRWKPRVRQYGMLEIVLVRLGDPDESSGVSGLFSVLLSEAMEPAEKIKRLELEYNMAMQPELSDEVNDMSGMGAYVFEKGVRQGMAQGIEQGMAQGIERGACSERAAIEANMRAKGLDEATIRDLLDTHSSQNQAMSSS